MQQISKYFEKADLPLVVTNEPFARGRGTGEIFQMDFPWFSGQVLTERLK